jgi:hypothetical protein
MIHHRLDHPASNGHRGDSCIKPRDLIGFKSIITVLLMDSVACELTRKCDGAVADRPSGRLPPGLDYPKVFQAQAFSLANIDADYSVVNDKIPQLELTRVAIKRSAPLVPPPL